MFEHTIEQYAEVVGDRIIVDLIKTARQLKCPNILNINSTFLGGGVMEILTSLLPISNKFGLNAEWRVLHGTPPFYDISKKIHNGLQGENIEFTQEEKDLYLRVNEAYFEYTSINPDFLIVHDPQPLPIVRHIKNPIFPMAWRLHIDLSNPNKELWDFIKRFVHLYDVVIVSMEGYMKNDLLVEQRVISPAIDPLSIKNINLGVGEILPMFQRRGIPLDKPIISQVSRMDKWKDPLGLLKIYEIVGQKIDCRLIYCFNVASDDPEGGMILNQLKDEARDYIKNKDIILISEDNPKLVNAIQTYSDVVIQKSIREGFCLLPDTKIITDLGYKEIKDIECGDKVLISSGSFESVNKTMHREVNCYYEVNCWKGIQLNITGEHPVFAAKRLNKTNFKALDWIPIEELNKGDYIATPIPKSESLDLILDLKDYDNLIRYDDIYVYYDWGYSGKRELSYSALTKILGVTKSFLERVVRHIKENTEPKKIEQRICLKKLLDLGYEVAVPEKINRFIDLKDKDIQWLFGLYIGNGSNNGAFIEFCFNKNKYYMIEKIQNIFKYKFNKDVLIRHEDNTVRLYCSSKILVKLFKQFGRYAVEKHIPQDWLKYGSNLRYMLVGLFDSDGCYYDTLASYSSVSEELIWQMWRLLLSLKIPAKIRECKVYESKGSFKSNHIPFTLNMGGREYHRFLESIVSDIHPPHKKRKRESNLCIVLEDYILYPIKNINKVNISTTVHDLEINNTHNFVANGYLVHNCLCVTESLWKKTPVVASNVGGIPSQIENGENGYLVDPYDYQGFADRIIELLKNKRLAQQMGEKGHGIVKEKFLITRLLRDYMELFHYLRG